MPDAPAGALIVIKEGFGLKDILLGVYKIKQT
jgi:hypothetical protein